MRQSSSFVKSALGFEEKGIFGDIEDISPVDKISNDSGRSKIDFKRIARESGVLAKKLVPSFKAQ